MTGVTCTNNISVFNSLMNFCLCKKITIITLGKEFLKMGEKLLKSLAFCEKKLTRSLAVFKHFLAVFIFENNLSIIFTKCIMIFFQNVMYRMVYDWFHFLRKIQYFLVSIKWYKISERNMKFEHDLHI